MTPLLVVYAAGVAMGLLMTDASLPARVGLSLLWPLGPIAFVLTMTLLIGLALVSFPLVGLALAAAGVVIWMLR